MVFDPSTVIEVLGLSDWPVDFMQRSIYDVYCIWEVFPVTDLLCPFLVRRPFDEVVKVVSKKWNYEFDVPFHDCWRHQKQRAQLTQRFVAPQPDHDEQDSVVHR